MGIQVALHHRTAYRYERPVSLGPQVVQLRPTPHCRTPISDYSLKISPSDHLLTWQFDALANHVARVLFSNKTSEFIIDVNGVPVTGCSRESLLVVYVENALCQAHAIKMLCKQYRAPAGLAQL